MHNFILLITTTIFSVVVPSYTTISFQQIPTSEFITVSCNVTNNSDMFPYDVISLHLSTPIDLSSNTLYCKTSTISDETKDMFFVRDTTAKSSPDIVDGERLTLKDCLFLILVIAMWSAAWPLLWKIDGIVEKWLRGREPMSKVYYEEFVVSVLRRVYELEAELYGGKPRRVKPEVIEIYLLKEAFLELERHPEIYEDPNLYDFAAEFMLESVKRAVFMRIPTDKKVVWLKNRYMSNMRFDSL